MKLILALIITCLIVVPSYAQEESNPKNLIGFLKPKMHVGIVTFENSDRVRIEIYSQEDQKILMDSRHMTLEQLELKYERVKKELARVRAEAIAERSGTLPIPKPGTSQPRVDVGLNAHNNETFYVITHVGEDYILLSGISNRLKRRAMSINFVSSISWNDQLPIDVYSVDGK